MKSLVFFGIIYFVMLPLLVIGCEKGVTTTESPAATAIEMTLDEFTTENNVTKNIELAPSGSLVVRLGSNPTTGYEWEEAAISDSAVIVQANREYVAPEDTGTVGAGGTDVWTFEAKEAGTATINISYGRPWEGGEKDTYTITINVTVK